MKRLEYVRSARLPFKVMDIFVFGAVLLAVLLLIILPSSKPKGNYAEVSVDGRRTVYRLDRDTRIELEQMVIIIENGKVHVTQATCKNKICQHMGEIGLVGQSITCAQNKIVITVRGDSDIAGTVG